MTYKLLMISEDDLKIIAGGGSVSFVLDENEIARLLDGPPIIVYSATSRYGISCIAEKHDISKFLEEKNG